MEIKLNGPKNSKWTDISSWTVLKTKRDGMVKWTVIFSQMNVDFHGRQLLLRRPSSTGHFRLYTVHFRWTVHFHHFLSPTLDITQILNTCSCPHSSVLLWQKWGSCSSKFVWPRIWRPNPWIIKNAKNTMNKWCVNQKTSKNDLRIGLEWFSF